MLRQRLPSLVQLLRLLDTVQAQVALHDQLHDHVLVLHVHDPEILVQDAPDIFLQTGRPQLNRRPLGRRV